MTDKELSLGAYFDDVTSLCERIFESRLKERAYERWEILRDTKIVLRGLGVTIPGEELDRILESRFTYISKKKVDNGIWVRIVNGFYGFGENHLDLVRAHSPEFHRSKLPELYNEEAAVQGGWKKLVEMKVLNAKDYELVDPGRPRSEMVGYSKHYSQVRLAREKGELVECGVDEKGDTKYKWVK